MLNITEKYRITHLIMESENGTVVAGFCRKTGIPVAIKEFPKKIVCEYRGSNKVPGEIYYHFAAYKLDPENVVRPIKWYETKASYITIMERPIGYLDLFDFRNKYGCQTEKTARIIWTQIAQAAHRLHQGKVCHRDIKDENILIDPLTLKIKMIDFGCAQSVLPYYHKSRGTAPYWPPEWFESKTARPEQLTVWSLGAILYILVCGEWKFEKRKFSRNFGKEMMLSKELQTLFNQILCKHDSSRILLTNILKSNWVNLEKPRASSVE